MVNNVNFINIREIASRVMRHPLMVDLTLEAVIQYTVDFISIIGLPPLYYDKVEEVEIKEHRAALPCDLVSIKQVKDKKNDTSMRATTDSYYLAEPVKRRQDRFLERQEGTFKVQGNVIFTTFKEGKVVISYKALPVDKDGLPMISDNSTFLRALEAFIKKEWFTVLFDMGKVSPAVLQNIQQEYAWRVGQLNMTFTIPSVSEMEAISNMMNQLVPKTNEFRKGFKPLGNREYLKDHR